MQARTEAPPIRLTLDEIAALAEIRRQPDGVEPGPRLAMSCALRLALAGFVVIIGGRLYAAPAA